MSSRRTAIIGLLFLVLLPLLAAGLDLLAKRLRAGSVSPATKLQVLVVADARELWQVYTRLELRGRLLLHIGRHLHFVEVAATDIYRPDRGSLANLDLDAAYLQSVNHRNYLWLAARAGMFRTIHYLLEEGSFQEKSAEAGVLGAEEFSVSDNGFPRVLSLRPVAGKEQPLVHIDGAWLEGHSPEETVALLKKLPVKPDIIILSASEDDPGRTVLARERIASLKGLLVNAGL